MALQESPADVPVPDPDRIAALADEVLAHLSGATISAMIYIGDRLGLYRALRNAGPVTSKALAARTGLNERWVREWLHSQASGGLLAYVGDGKYQLTPEQDAVLADESSADLLVGGFSLVLPLFESLERIENAFRTGRGVTYDGLGKRHAIGEARFSGPWMRANLVPVILPALGDVAQKLAVGAKAADVGCGSGRALLELAKAFPRSQFHGYDSSELAIGLANENLAASGLNNVTFHHAPADALPRDGSFGFVMTWDCLHDMTDPLASMTAIRKAIDDDGAWLIVDINGRPTSEENYREPLSGLLYSISVLDCLNCGTCKEGAAGLGTLGFPEPVAKEMTAQAGFTQFKTHDFGNPLNSFFEVRP